MRVIAAILALLLIAATVVALTYRGNAANARAARDAAVTSQEAAEAERDSALAVIKTERARADAMSTLAETYEQERNHAQQASDRVVADLHADNLRLRNRWRGCPAVPALGASTGEFDAATDDRAESAGRIVRAAAECDAQVRGLQAVVKADRARVLP